MSSLVAYPEGALSPEAHVLDLGDADTGRAPLRRRSPSVVVHLLLLAAGLLVPALLVLAGGLSLFLDAQNGLLRLEAQHRVKTAAAIVSGQLDALRQFVSALAGSKLLHEDELDRFRQESQILGPTLGLRIVLASARHGETVLDSASAANDARLDAHVREAEQRASFLLETAVSEPFYSPSPTGDWFVAAVAPVVRDGEIRYLLSAIIPVSRIARRIEHTLPADGSTVLLTDHEGTVMAHIGGGESLRGLPAPNWLRRATPETDVVSGQTISRPAPLSAAVRLAEYDWTVAVRLAPTAAHPAQQAVILFAFAGVTLIGFGAAGALLFASRIARSVRSLSALGIRLSHGQRHSPPVTPVSEVNEVGLALVKAAKTARELERELREAHKMEAMGRLTGGIAHDFNNLLTIIIGNLEMLGEELENVVKEEQKALLAEARQSADVSVGLINQLLAFARRQSLDPVLADIGQLVSDTARLLERTLGDKIEIDVVVEPGLHSFVDVAQFKTSIINLAANARDAMPEGGIVTIAVSRAHVAGGEASAKFGLGSGAYVAVSVTDSGTGMAQEIREHAFEPFFTTKTPGIGTGLGLSVVHGFVKQCGGNVWIRSASDQGTTVEFWIPEAAA